MLMPAMSTATTRKSTTESVTIYDVARQAGVSVVTVSRAFNNYPHVSARMRTRVLEAARQVGFSPKLVARPRRLAVVIGHLDQLHGGDYKTRMLMHLIACAARRGYAIEFIPAEEVDLAVQRSVDGVIEFALTSREIECLEQLPDVPVVLINKKTTKPKRWSTVCSDHRMEARLAARYLIERGHRRIALVLDERTGWSAEQRQSGYVEAMRKAWGKRADILALSSADMTVAQMASRIRSARCTALINLSDNAGLALLGHLKHVHRADIPRRLSVIGLEQDAVSAHLSPPLTTIEQPLAALAEAAVAGLITIIDKGGRGKTFHPTLQSRLIERESVAVLRRK